MHADHPILGSRSPKPSHITLPRLDQPFPCMLDFLDGHFPRVGRAVWLARLRSGAVLDEQGRRVGEDTPYRINARLSYYREVAREPRIPFTETILYEDDDILLADKPHFLPVTPAGNYVNECLLHRLILRTGNGELVPVHRLDRETAGLVLFSKRQATRKAYFALFREGNIDKQYEAVASLPVDGERREWRVESRIERSEAWITFANVPGEVNARSIIRLAEVDGDVGRFILSPLTGKTHQLRLHMGLIGSHILNDSFYPELLPFPDVPDYSRPLQLLARELGFVDPVSGAVQRFESANRLQAWPEKVAG
ncbi:MAG: pseudouridine synthase [Zetaproteobacteria bacterium CG2_30_59_37]|nr:MAG: pseudouridine synthase [Zetaproteobacteria bacterium CG2_30_59_37]